MSCVGTKADENVSCSVLAYTPLLNRPIRPLQHFKCYLSVYVYRPSLMNLLRIPSLISLMRQKIKLTLAVIAHCSISAYSLKANAL
jgi:hypothetical protein